MDTFGQRLKTEREKKGFNQKEFAEAIGITPTRLNYWEKDKREPDFPNIRKIIDVLDCDADYLLGTKFSKSPVAKVEKQVHSSINEENLLAPNVLLKETIGKRLYCRRNELNLSIENVISQLESYGFSITAKTLYSWENGRGQANADIFLVLCKIYSIENILLYFGFFTSPAIVTSADENLLKKYNALDERGKRSVDTVLDDQYDCLYPVSENEVG